MERLRGASCVILQPHYIVIVRLTRRMAYGAVGASWSASATGAKLNRSSNSTLEPAATGTSVTNVNLSDSVSSCCRCWGSMSMASEASYSVQPRTLPSSADARLAQFADASAEQLGCSDVAGAGSARNRGALLAGMARQGRTVPTRPDREYRAGAPIR